MKILVTSLPDLKKINHQRPHHLLKYLSQKHEVTVLCVNAWWLKERQDEYLRTSLKSVNIHYISENKLSPVFQEIFAIKSLKNLGNLDFDIHISLNSLLMGYSVAKKLKVPSLFDICDDIISWIDSSPRIPTLLKPIAKVVGAFMLKRNIKISERITYSTEFLKSSYSLPENKSVLIPNGVDTNLFYKRNGKTKAKERFNISEDVLVLGFVGFLGEWIDLQTVFETMKILQGQVKIKLIVVGNGSKFARFKELSKNCGVQENVIFTGDVPYSEVPEYISYMDICLLPFDTSAVSQGALPLKLFEYMACEKPVISTPLSGVKNTVGDLVFYASNAEELKQRILELYYNDDLRIELGKRGGDFVERNYSWERICRKFEEVLVEASESKRGHI